MTIDEKRDKLEAELEGLSRYELMGIAHSEDIPLLARMTRARMIKEIVETRLAPEIWKAIEGRP